MTTIPENANQPETPKQDLPKPNQAEQFSENDPTKGEVRKVNEHEANLLLQQHLS